MNGNDLKPCGVCYNCGEPIAVSQIYCNRECQYEHEDEMNHAKHPMKQEDGHAESNQVHGI